MKSLDGVRKVMREQTVTSAKLAEALATVRGQEAEARAEAVRLTEARAPLLADEVALGKNREAIRTCAERVDDLGLFAIELKKRLSAAIAAEDQVRRQTVYDAARAEVDAANNALAAYEKAAAPLLKLLRIVSSGHLAADDANALLPDGAPGLGIIYPNAVNGLPLKIERETIVDLWCVEGDPRPLGDELQAKVKPTEPGCGLIYCGNDQPHQNQATRVVRRTFKRTQYRPAVDGFYPNPIAETLCLPGLLLPPPRMRHPSGYEFPISVDHRTVIAAIDAALATKTPPLPATRPLIVEYEALPAERLKEAAQ